MACYGQDLGIRPHDHLAAVSRTASSLTVLTVLRADTVSVRAELCVTRADRWSQLEYLRPLGHPDMLHVSQLQSCSLGPEILYHTMTLSFHTNPKLNSFIKTRIRLPAFTVRDSEIR